MLGLFSQKNLVLCDMQGNNYGLLMKKKKKILKITFRPAERVLTFDTTIGTNPTIGTNGPSV